MQGGNDERYVTRALQAHECTGWVCGHCLGIKWASLPAVARRKSRRKQKQRLHKEMKMVDKEMPE